VFESPRAHHFYVLPLRAKKPVIWTAFRRVHVRFEPSTQSARQGGRHIVLRSLNIWIEDTNVLQCTPIPESVQIFWGTQSFLSHVGSMLLAFFDDRQPDVSVDRCG
jgi:hypothetical protein